MRHAAAFVLMIALSGFADGGQLRLVQAQPADDAHTLFQAPSQPGGQAGRTVPLPSGGVGVTTGGTSHYQTYATPGGSGVTVPNAGGSPIVSGAGAHPGEATPPR